jgi:hypothetical protein
MSVEKTYRQGIGFRNLSIVSTTPSGSNTQIQYNNSGAFGGSASLTWDGSQLAVIKQTITSPSTVIVPFTIVGASGQTANLLEVKNSSGTLRFSVEANGTIKAPANVGAGNAFWFYNQNLLMQATVAQLSAPGNCYVFADNGGTDLRQIKSHSIFLTGSNADVLTTFTRLAAISGSATQRCGVFRCAASSSVNNTEWQDSSGTVVAAIKSTGILNLPAYTVATLPAGAAGDRCYVTDALSPVFLTALTGGGAVRTPAFHNGTSWVAG